VNYRSVVNFNSIQKVLAAKSNSREIVELLLEQKATLDTKAKDVLQRTPLMIACCAKCTGTENIAEIFIQSGIDVNARCISHETALMYGTCTTWIYLKGVIYGLFTI
jgi:Ankyrin repeats (3 copies)